MSERWVVNASPIIVLAKVAHQHLLLQLPDQFVIPEAVIAEIHDGPEDDPARLFLYDHTLPVVAVPPQPAISAWDLGAGETAVLSYAQENPGWRVVIDDNMARRCARSFSIPIIGTLGIVLRARRAGLIEAAVPLLRSLVAHGFRIDEDVIRPALKDIVGESWD